MAAEKAGPLQVLILRLKAWSPPSIGVLIAQIGDSEGYLEFIGIIRELLPQNEAEILRESTIADQVELFANRFETRYFPLGGGVWDWDWVESYHDFCYQIPIEVQGISWEEYEQMPDSDYYRAGLQLMTYLVQDLEVACGYGEGHVRVVLAEVCARHAPQSLLERIPGGGWRAEELRRVVQNSPYSGLGTWLSVLERDTNTFFLDADEEIVGYNQIDWTLENVEELTRQHATAERITQEYHKFSEWLEEDMPAHFAELVDFIERRIREESAD